MWHFTRFFVFTIYAPLQNAQDDWQINNRIPPPWSRTHTIIRPLA